MSDIPDWWQKPRIVSVVVDTPGWFVSFAHCLVERLQMGGDDARFITDYSAVPTGSVAFYLSCTKITPAAILARNRCNLVVHESDLPKGRGFSPAVWQLIEAKNRIPVLIIQAREAVDSGEIVMRGELLLEGHELNGEWRRSLGNKTVDMCCAVLAHPSPPQGEPQVGDPSWYRRRSPKDSRLDPTKGIAEQFNLLRVVDNDRYPAFFDTAATDTSCALRKWDRNPRVANRARGKMNDSFAERATSKDMLESRIAINARLQTTDFNKWLFERINVRKGALVLDVGCGTGQQTEQFSRAVGRKGRVVAFDISPASIAALHERIGEPTNVTAFVGDMDKFPELQVTHFRETSFDIVHSTYAIYYATVPQVTLTRLASVLKPDGALVCFVPNAPHGMVEFARRFHAIPQAVDDSLRFGPERLAPFFRERFTHVQTDLFENKLNFESASDFIRLYRATTYHSVGHDSEVEAAVAGHLAQHGNLAIEKRGYLIVGTVRRDSS